MINKDRLFLLEETVKKNFSAKYKDSVLGIFWSVLKPLLIMILLTIIFSTLFGNRVRYGAPLDRSAAAGYAVLVLVFFQL